MRVRTAQGYESRAAFSPGGSYQWSDSLIYSAAVPPHGFSTLSRGGVNITEHTVTQAGPVNRALSVITNNMLIMGAPRPYTWAYDDQNRAYHKAVAPIPPVLLDPWGADCLPSEGMTQIIYSMGLFGEAYCLVLTRDDMGNPTSLEILPAPFVDADKDDQGNKVYALVGLGTVQPLPAEDVVHIRLRARPGAIKAASSLQEENLGYALFLAAAQFGLQYFGQGVHSSFVLTTDQQLNDTVIDRIMAKLIVEHTGLNMAHLPMIFSSGIKPQQMTVTPEQAQMLGTLLSATDDIAAYFGIPSEWLGGSPNPNSIGKTFEEQCTFVAQETMPAYYTAIQETFASMLPKGQYCQYNTRKLVRADSANFARELLSIRTGAIMTQNDVRMDFYDLPPLPGGDDLNAPLASNQAPGMTGQVMNDND